MKSNYKLEVLERIPKIKTYDKILLFIHGAQAGAWTFEYFLDYFESKGFECYALSLRGHGKSEGYEMIDTFGLDDYVSDVLSVVSKLNSKPILIGHSMGGAIVQRYVRDYQDTIDSAILLSSAVYGGIDQDSPLGMFFSDSKSFLRKLRNEHKDQKITLETLMRKVVLSPRFSEPEISEIRQLLTKESKRVKEDLMKPFLPYDFKLNIKVHVIGSKDDLIVGLDDIYKTAKGLHTKPMILSELCHFLTIDPNWIKVAEAIEMILK